MRLEENINFGFHGDSSLSDKSRITALENALEELINRVEFCFNNLESGVSEELVKKIALNAAKEKELGYTKTISFTDGGFELTFTTENGEYINKFTVSKNNDGYIAKIVNLTADKEINVIYNNETEVQ